jgi:hypothetical protein
MIGGAVVDLNDGRGAMYYDNSLFVFDPANERLLVLIGGVTPATSAGGWYIRSFNSTAVRIVAWVTDRASNTSNTKVCNNWLSDADFGYAFCGGSVAGAPYPPFYSDLISQYQQGIVMYQIATNDIGFGQFQSRNYGCAPMSIVSASPLNSAMFQATIFGGVPSVDARIFDNPLC